MSGRPDLRDGSAEAARWVADALRNACDWFPDMSDDELRGPLEQAFELAGRAVRGEREFHSVFEAELRRAIEERSVVGSAGSVLPAQSPGSPKTFPLVANTTTRTVPAQAEPATVEGLPAETDQHRAESFARRVGALRFHDGRSCEEICAELRVDEEYYSKATRWLLGRADRTLDGDYPRHLDRRRMFSHAAGIGSIEDSFAVERHVRECPGCATYLADLLEATLGALATGPGGEPTAGAPQVTYTTANAWTPDAHPRQRVPVMSVKADELRKYAQSAESALAASPAVETAEVRPIRPVVTDRASPPSKRASKTARPAPWRRMLVGFATAATMLAVVTAGLIALTGGGDDPAPRQALAAGERDGGAARTAGPSDAELAARARARRLARKQAAERKQAARRRARARARRAAHRRRAAAQRRRAQRERQQREQAAAPAPTAPAPTQPAPAPAPAPAPVNPQPTAPSGGSGGSNEFGLEP